MEIADIATDVIDDDDGRDVVKCFWCGELCSKTDAHQVGNSRSYKDHDNIKLISSLASSVRMANSIVILVMS